MRRRHSKTAEVREVLEQAGLAHNSPLKLLAGLALSMVLTALGALISPVVALWLVLVGGLLLGAVLLWAALWDKHHPPIDKLEERAPEKKAGLILPLSPLSSRGTPWEKDDDAWKAVLARASDGDGSAASDAEWDALVESNLKPALAALSYHAENNGPLSHVWLLPTRDETTKQGVTTTGSWRTVPVLINAFRRRFPNAPVRFHPESVNDGWTKEEVAALPGPRDYGALSEQVELAYQTLPIKEREIILEITPGTSVMTAALALCCDGSRRTMQYMTGNRHPVTGEHLPAGVLRPVLISVDRVAIDLDAEPMPTAPVVDLQPRLTGDDEATAGESVDVKGH